MGQRRKIPEDDEFLTKPELLEKIDNITTRARSSNLSNEHITVMQDGMRTYVLDAMNPEHVPATKLGLWNGKPLRELSKDEWMEYEAWNKNQKRAPEWKKAG